MPHTVILLDLLAPQSSPMGWYHFRPHLAYNHFSVPRLLPFTNTRSGGRSHSLCATLCSSFPFLPLAYIPKKVASKARAPRRRQRKTQRPPLPEVPKEIPPEAVKEYADIMEGLVGSHLASGGSDGKQEEEEEQQQEEEGMYPDPGLLGYIEELCSQEVFVSKVGRTWVSGF